MPVSVVQGKLGTGKSKFCVLKMQEALRQGRPVATNLDLYLEHLVPASSRATVYRLPDKPTAADLDGLGHGNPASYDEDRNGVLVLDELGSWLNARSFQDKDRAAVLDWLIHARKKGWDVYLIVQDVSMIDKQVRQGLAEYVIKCVRMDRIKLPIIGALLGKHGRLPRAHLANYTMSDVPGIVVDREWFRGDDLHKAYDTRQIFTANGPGLHSVLSAWHIKGRHMQPNQRRGWLSWLFSVPSKPQPKDKHPLIARLSNLPPDRAAYWSARLVREGIV